MANMSNEKLFNVGVKGIIQDSKRGIILLHRDYKSGDFWDMPGGRIDQDEDFKDTLLRELAEELPGITNIKIGKLLGAFRLKKDINENVSLVLLYFLVDARLPDEVKLSDEHESYVWIKSHSDVPKGLNPEVQKILEDLLT
jgi:8-oxo-dGTP diphosphatase